MQTSIDDSFNRKRQQKQISYDFFFIQKVVKTPKQKTLKQK